MIIADTQIKPILTESMIRERIVEIADKLNEEYKDEVYVVCVLKGAIMFCTDLIKYLKMPVKTEFIRLSSYGSGTISSGKVDAMDVALSDLNNKDVIIVEDIVDTGYSAQFMREYINQKFKVKSYKFISLLNKKSRREVNVDPDMYGFDMDDKFLVGYGLDYEGLYRNLPYIGYIET